MEEYAKKIKEMKLSDEAKEMAEKELHKLKLMPSMSSEANVVRNYIDWLLCMPWAEKTEDNFDLEKAEKVLNAQHYGLEKVKERIIEYLAVAQQVGKMKGPIICSGRTSGCRKNISGPFCCRSFGKEICARKP